MFFGVNDERKHLTELSEVDSVRLVDVKQGKDPL
jgi:hypothetical protein